MPAQAIYELCTSNKTVTAAMEKEPTAVVLDVARKVFPEKPQTAVASRSKKVRLHDDYTEEDLEKAEKCGKFPYKPSPLFLRVSSRCDIRVLYGG